MDFDNGFVIASEAKQSRLSVRRYPFVWIASLSLAMTAHRGVPHGFSFAERLVNGPDLSS